MKIVNKFIVLILLFVFTSNSQAQTSYERKDCGPTFITSASFVKVFIKLLMGNQQHCQ